MTAVAEYVGDTLVNVCDRPAPDRVLRYFGTTGLPQDVQCSPDGVLSVAWDRGWGTKNFPAEDSQRGAICPGFPTYLLAIRYDVCWKAPTITKAGVVILEDAQWDADAAMLADVADCVARALLRLGCPPAATPFAEAVLAECRLNSWAYRDVVPSLGGGAARLTWRAFAGVGSP